MLWASRMGIWERGIRRKVKPALGDRVTHPPGPRKPQGCSQRERNCLLRHTCTLFGVSAPPHWTLPILDTAFSPRQGRGRSRGLVRCSALSVCGLQLPMTSVPVAHTALSTKAATSAWVRAKRAPVSCTPQMTPGQRPPPPSMLCALCQGTSPTALAFSLAGRCLASQAPSDLRGV